MIYVIVFIAFILTWFFIEITLFYTNKNDYFVNSKSQITYKEFIWFLRIIALLMILSTIIYMYMPLTNRATLGSGEGPIMSLSIFDMAAAIRKQLNELVQKSKHAERQEVKPVFLTHSP